MNLADHSPISRLACSLRPSAPWGATFVNLAAYYDESGTHGGSPITVLAGFVAGVNEWVPFEREWAKVLRKHGITHVRAKHLFHRQGEHKGWSEGQIDSLEADLLYVFQEHQLYASKTILRECDYTFVYKASPIAKRERLDSRYALCIRAFLHSLPTWHLRRYPQGVVDFVFESGHRNAPDAVRVFNEIKNDETIPHRDALGFLSFGAKRDSPALQAADMFAYWTFKHEVENLSEPDEYISWIDCEFIEMDLPVIQHLVRPRELTDLRGNRISKGTAKEVIGAVRLDADTDERDFSDLWYLVD